MYECVKNWKSGDFIKFVCMILPLLNLKKLTESIILLPFANGNWISEAIKYPTQRSSINEIQLMEIDDRLQYKSIESMALKTPAPRSPLLSTPC